MCTDGFPKVQLHQIWDTDCLAIVVQPSACSLTISIQSSSAQQAAYTGCYSTGTQVQRSNSSHQVDRSCKHPVGAGLGWCQWLFWHVGWFKFSCKSVWYYGIGFSSNFCSSGPSHSIYTAGTSRFRSLIEGLQTREALVFTLLAIYCLVRSWRDLSLCSGCNYMGLFETGFAKDLVLNACACAQV